ncbi:MAG: AraC family transcriptional regulator [Novosphingobium sp.]
MSELVRVAALTGYLDTMRSFGADPRRLLREQGLTAAQLNDPERHIPARAANRLLERSAQVTGCCTFGLRMAEGRTMANLGAASLVIAHQPSLRHALQALGEFRARINSTLSLSIESIGDDVIVREDANVTGEASLWQSTDLILGVLMRMCSAVMGEAWSPRGVCFTHQPPPRSDLGDYLRVFRCRPEFDSAFNALIIAASDLDRPSRLADDQMAGHARRLLEAMPGPIGRSAAEDSEAAIRLLLPSGQATIQGCAVAMGLSVRTLQRRLDREGQHFSQILSRTRQQLTAEYLSNPRLRITDIADMLGYGSTAAFTRWHGETYGQSPREARAALRR